MNNRKENNKQLGTKRKGVEYSNEWSNMPRFMRKKKHVYPLTIRQEAKLLKEAWAEMRQNEKSTPIISRKPEKEIVIVHEKYVKIKKPGISITGVLIYIPVKLIIGIKKVCVHIVKRICGY
jgi:hypothetical protein